MKNVLVVLASIACGILVGLAAYLVAMLGPIAIIWLTSTVLPGVPGVIVGCVIMLAIGVLAFIAALKIGN